jgi:hypothetical protein
VTEIPGVPDALARAMRAQGLVDPEEVAARLADAIPPDDAAVAEQQGDWRSQLPDDEDADLSEAERAMIQPSLLDDAPTFDAAASDAGRDAGMARVLNAADPEWKAVARGAIGALIDDGDEFTADDVWARVGSYPIERRALGPLLRAEADAGRIENTGRRRNSARPEHHSYPMRVWRPVVR